MDKGELGLGSISGRPFEKGWREGVTHTSHDEPLLWLVWRTSVPSPKHRLIWYLGLGWPSYCCARSSAGAETMRVGMRILHATWGPLCAHIPHRHPLCTYALCPLPCPIPIYSRTVYPMLPCLCPLPPTPIRSLHAFVPIPCPLLSPMPVLCPLSLMPKSCALSHLQRCPYLRPL